uniref:Uncharacterized protein n=1 Tax=Cacopsylla melanoneura TaxID=428564 RepID=A0A8D8X903_9HEMI
MLLTSPITSNASNYSPPQHPMPATVLHLNILMPPTVTTVNILCQLCRLSPSLTSYVNYCLPPQHPMSTNVSQLNTKNSIEANVQTTNMNKTAVPSSPPSVFIINLFL